MHSFFPPRNAVPQTSLDTSSHFKMKEMQERGDPCLFVEAPLTNGHAHLFNGALKPEDLSPAADPSSSDGDASTCRARSSTEKPQSPAVQSHAKTDPYEFPPSPPRRSAFSHVPPERSSTQEGGGDEPKPPPTSWIPQPPPESLHPPAKVEPISERAPLSPASRSLSHFSVRPNGSHHKVSSRDAPLLDAAHALAHPGPPAEGPSTSTSSDQLLAQTGGLISEFYSRSRLHQISTWRVAFSEYVNELHIKRKTEGSPSYPGKDRLRKSAAQKSTRGPGGGKDLLLSCLV